MENQEQKDAERTETSEKKDAAKDELAGSGSCKKCNCPSFRPDATSEPETCLNIRPPSTLLCGHLGSDHR